MSSKSSSLPTMNNVYNFMVKMKKPNFNKMNMASKLSIRSYMQKSAVKNSPAKPRIPIETETKLKNLIYCLACTAGHSVRLR